MISAIQSSFKLVAAITILTITACSTQQIKQDSTTAEPAKEQTKSGNDGKAISGESPPLTLIKDNKKLNLVRIMDGGVCKNDLQGAKGTFLLYANQPDIERIKKQKGAKIFSDFESKIQTLSTEALQQAIHATNLDEDPFALGEDEAQQKLATDIADNFRAAISDPIRVFEKETTLTIDIAAFSPSFTFYQKGCEATLLDENAEAVN
jgi:hypothetical protein